MAEPNNYDETDRNPGYTPMQDFTEPEVAETGVTVEHRTILLNQSQPIHFCSNYISTAKYNAFTFLPKFLFEQFRKYANIFFLFITLLQQIPSVSPTGRFTTGVPLLAILLVSAIKEIIEDVKRHRADDAVNRSDVFVLRQRQWTPVKWMDVVVGDFLKVVNHTPFPADLLILSSSEPQAMCYIETANLDGETNLKIRQGLKQTSHLLTHDDLLALEGKVECELANRHLYEFAGNLHLRGQRPLPVGPDQMLLRGSMLRNTKWVFGMAVYTGNESKLMLNSTGTPLKRSNVEKITNIQILILFGLLIVIALVCSTLNQLWTDENADKMWYLGLTSTNFGLNFLTFVILFNNLIPISLPVTLEVVKFIQAWFINWDVEMYYEPTNTPATARTSNLNEELGQVKYIFTDKTGTLTRNVMDLRKLSVAGTVYGDNEGSETGLNDPAMDQDLSDKNKGHGMHEFLIALSVCHTVVPERDPNDDSKILYQASSPDENALVKGAKNMNYAFTTRTPDSVTVDVNGKPHTFQILNVLDFTSDRKRMSVVVKTPSGEIKLYCKGADTVIYERLSEGQSFADVTLQHLEDFANLGLRTLCIASSNISEERYQEWKEIYFKASTAIQNRERLLEEAAELIETELFLMGATAIEDKLQQGVPESIADLIKADIKIWVLTGDKQETAINIGHSCKLLTEDMPLVIINEQSLDSTREALRRHMAEFGELLGKENDVGLVVDGKTLKYALLCDCRKDFLELAVSCKVVICCRVSPLQKAELVQLVKQNVKVITLAIGDGANDVGMIQAADVGIGISGVEGLQATCASDYAIAQFRFLNRLLFVHGAWNYSRVSKLILYSFYKNICLYLIELWFAIFNGFSGQILFERWQIGLYNVIFTAAPPLALGLFDQYCSAKCLLKFPPLYKTSQNAELFNVKVFWTWMFNSIYHSALLYFLTLLMMKQDIAFLDGKLGGFMFMGNMCYTYVVITVCIKAGLEYTSWTWLSHLAVWGSILSWFVYLVGYSHFWPVVPMGAEMVGMDIMVLTCPIFWMGLLVIPLICLLRDVVWTTLRRTLRKSLREEAQEAEVNKEDFTDVMRTHKPRRLTEASQLLKNMFTRSRGRMQASRPQESAHGFAFSQEEHGVVPQADIIRVYDSTKKKPSGN